MAVRVLCIRGLGGQFEADQTDDIGRSIRKVVQCIRHDGNGTKQHARRQLAKAQQQVTDHAHNARQVAIRGTHGRVFGVVRGMDEASDQKPGHNHSPFSCTGKGAG